MSEAGVTLLALILKSKLRCKPSEGSGSSQERIINITGGINTCLFSSIEKPIKRPGAVLKRITEPLLG